MRHITKSASNQEGAPTGPALIVDYEPEFRAELRDGLMDMGLDVREAPGMAEALEEFGADAPEFVFLNPEMLGARGFLTNRKHSNRKFRRMGLAGGREPAFILTVSADARDERDWESWGADDILTRPFAPADLRTTLRLLAS